METHAHFKTFLLITVLLAFISSYSTVQAETPYTYQQYKEVVDLFFSEEWNVPLIDCPVGSSEQKREEIRTYLSQGYTKDEIKTIFVEKYGTNVLISPPFSGFNILAWTLPFVALFGAGYFIFIYIRKREESQPSAPVAKKKRDREELIEEEILKASIEEEMKKYR